MSEKLHKDERETIITFCEADDEYIVETSIAVHMRKFDKLGYECIGEQRYSDGSTMSKEYRVPKFAITFRKPVKRVSRMTEEQRAAAAVRARNLTKAKSTPELVSVLDE